MSKPSSRLSGQRYIFGLKATQDRDEIYDYIEAHNPAAALVLDELFTEKAG